MKDYYYLLGLKQTANLDDIKNSYRKLSKKFHPDVNEGDLYFAERFKDIQEAYEVLSNPNKRQLYDLEYTNKSESSENNSIFNPEIKLFESNKSVIHVGDEISFRWKTINADIVILEPFGPVDASGEITYKIKRSNVDQIKFKLVAINSNNQVKSEKLLIVNNIIFESIKNRVPENKISEPDLSSHFIQQEPYLKQNRFYKIFINITTPIFNVISLSVAFILSIGLLIYIIYMVYKLLMDFKTN